MKRVILLPVFLLAMAALFIDAGGKCKFDYDKVDKFSGNHVRYNTYSVGGAFAPYKIQIGDNAGQFYFNFLIVVNGDNLSKLSTSDTSFIKLENGKTIKLAVKEDVAPTAQVSGTTVVTYYSPIYYIKKSKMKALSESKIIAVKIVVAGKDFTFDIKDSKAEKIMETAGCLISESGGE